MPAKPLRGAALAALAIIPGVAPAQTAAPPLATPDASGATQPAGLQLSLPLIWRGRLHDDVAVEAFTDGGIAYERQRLIVALAPLLSPDGQQRFDAALAPSAFVSAEDVARAGVELRYDSGQLEIHVERIDPALAPTQSIGTLDSSEVPISVFPERFSGYLNVVGDFRLDDFERFETPGLLLFGAARFGQIVFEFDGGYDRLLGEGGFYRRSTRLVYDQREQYRRWSAGDVQLRGSSLLGGTLLGGVAVEKGRRIFSEFGPLVSLGGQQVLLERDATVDVVVNGEQVDTLQLSAGPYDFAPLQAQYGGRNTQFFVTDVTGRRQLAGIDAFFDPSDLAAGEEEYQAGIGLVASTFELQPNYSGDPAFSGSYRRGLTNRLAVGGALQLSEDVVVVGGDVSVTPQTIPGRFELSAAMSQAGRTGFALAGSYGIAFGNTGNLTSFSLSGEYRDRNFTTLNDAFFRQGLRSVTITGAVSRAFGDRMTVLGGFNHFDREGFRTTQTMFADVLYRARLFRLTVGAEYGNGVFGRRFGARAAISVPLGGRTRADASYNGRRDDFRAVVSRSSEDRVGGFGYDLGVRRSQRETGIDANADYVGNRFYSRLALTTGGRGFSNIGDRQFARMQIGTSVAFAGGDVAIGRPINDSFVIAKPHPELRGEQVVLGASVHDRRYEALSGLWGPALGSRLNSYARQSIVYDLAGGDGGQDIGTGIETVEPPYRSGYRIVVGTGATTSAFGFLVFPDGPAQLASGVVTSPDDADFTSQPFFTNSVGRFAIMGLRPGRTYEIYLRGSEIRHSFRVPEDAETLFQLGEVAVDAPRRIQE